MLAGVTAAKGELANPSLDFGLQRVEALVAIEAELGGVDELRIRPHAGGKGRITRHRQVGVDGVVETAAARAEVRGANSNVS